MPLRAARRVGDTVQYRDASGNTQNVVVTGAAEDLPVPATPTSSTATTGGTLAATTTFGYKVTAIVNGAETQASPQKTQTTGAGATNTVTIDWVATQVAGATAYRVYGRTNSGPWGFLVEVSGATTSYIDTGAATPGQAAPTTTDHVGVTGPHDNTKRVRVLKATGMKDTDRYFHRW